MSIDFSLSAILPVMRMCNPLQALLRCDNLGKGSKVYVEGRSENTEHTTVTSNIFTVSALRALRSSRNPSPIPLVIASREYRLPMAESARYST